MVVVIDYGMGNLGSIVNTFRRLDTAISITSDPRAIKDADKIILPGVGSFSKGIENLKKLNLIPVLEECVLEDKVPFLGICLGMQLLTEKSEEGAVEGLGWVNAETVRFRPVLQMPHFKIPHMGWNALSAKEGASLLEGVTSDDRFYFVHSYHVSKASDDNVIATTTYGYDFPSVIQKHNIFGIQCHPERSHKSGLKVLKNFMRL